MADSFQLKAIITGVDKLSPVLDGISKNLKKAGKGFQQKALVASAMGTGLAMAFVKPIKDAMAFESSMADVRKVVNFDNPQQFKQMGQDILDMSTKLPMAATDIAKIVAAGGQAGIAANGLKEFATDAVKMGIAFDEGADVAGQQMAQWRVSLGLTQKQVEQLGDQINYLGNTGPVASNRLTDVVTDIGSLGKLAHLTAGEVAALGDTIMAGGTQADVASTGIKRVITTLAGGHLTKLQRKAFHALHLNPKIVAADMQKNGKKAILEVFSALSKVDPGKQIGITKALFGHESIEAIASLLANLQQLQNNFNKVGDSARYAGSMQKEYSSRADTTANKLELLQNDLKKISVETGDALLPAISDGLSQAMPLLNEVAGFIKNNPEVVKVAAAAGVGLAAIGGMAAISMLVAAAGPIGILLGGLVGAGVYMAEHWGDIQKIIDSNKSDSDTYKKAKQVTDSYSFGKNVDTTPIVQDPFGFNKQRQLSPSVQMGVIGSGVNYLPYAWIDLAKKFSADVNAATGGFPGVLTAWRGAPEYNYGAPGGQEILSGGRTLLAGEMVVRFENAPPGMRVTDGKTNAPNVKMTPEVGYSQYSSQSMFRGNY
ncbi:phage tail tape measure protein [Salmonella enterica]|nr:phage tail tape measure protein [Salmonella enterica]